MGLNAGDALRLLAQHPSIGGAIGMGLLGGSGALAYNAISKPTLDEYGNTIESNDINPFVAALGGAAIGAVGGEIYGKMNQPVARPVPKDASIPIPEEYLENFRTQTKPVRQVRLQNEIDDLRADIAVAKRSLDNYNQYKADYAEGVNDLREASTPIRQIVRANPMKPQNPMSPPGADIVVVPQNPVQESADELMALQNLAGSQGNPANLVIEYFDPSPNVKTFVQDVYSPKGEYLYSQIGQKQFQNPDRLPKSIQQPVRPGQEESITTRQELAEKQRIQNLQPVYKPRSDDEEMASMQWLRNNRANYQNYQAQKLEADAATRYQRQQAARRDMHVGGWNNSKGNYNTQYPEDNQYNIAGWDLVNPTPGAAQWQREAAIIQAQKKMM